MLTESDAEETQESMIQTPTTDIDFTGEFQMRWTFIYILI